MLRRVQPELHQHIIGLQRNIRQKLAAPIAIGGLFFHQTDRAGLGSGAGGITEALALLKKFAYDGAAAERLWRGKYYVHPEICTSTEAGTFKL